MAIRILQITDTEAGLPTKLKEIPFAYMDGSMTGIDVLAGKPVEIKIWNGKLECEAVHIHTSSYSRRALNKMVNEMFKSSGPQSMDALSSTRDLMDSSCLIYDDLRPTELNPNQAPIVINGAPVKGKVSDDDDDDDDI